MRIFQNDFDERTLEIDYESNQVEIDSRVQQDDKTDELSIKFKTDSSNGEPRLELDYFSDLYSNPVDLNFIVKYHQLIEYQDEGTSGNGYQEGEEIKIYNIGSEDDSNGWENIEYSLKDINEIKLHEFYTTTKDEVFSINLSISNSPIEINNKEFSPKSLIINIGINDFPFDQPNSQLALNAQFDTNYEVTKNNPINKIFSWENTASSDNLLIEVANSSLIDSMEENKHNIYYSFLSNEMQDIKWNTNFGITNINDTNNDQFSSSIPLLSQPQTQQFQVQTENIAFVAILISLLIGILTFFYYLLRKIWENLLSGIVVIGTALYVPNRKLNAIEALHSPNRSQIMDLLDEIGEKGETLRNLSSILDMPLATLIWHLKILVDFDFITKMKIRKETVIISNNFIDNFDPNLKEVELSFKSPQGILFWRFLVSIVPDQSFHLNEIIESTNWHKKTAQKHIRRLLNLNVLIKANNEKEYYINQKYSIGIKKFKFDF
jgi:predicted transcriptional regulator